MARACEGLRVVEISEGMPGAMAAMILADHGAEVIRIESPQPDRFLSDAAGHLWNRGKKRICLDLEDAEQLAAAVSLAREADVVILGIRPSAAIQHGLTFEILAADRPRLIVATVTAFGWDGPHRDEAPWDSLVHALSGSMMLPQNSGYRPGPIFLRTPFASYAAGMLCAQGVLAALHWRESSGLGQHVDSSILDGVLAYRGAALFQPDEHPEDFPVSTITPNPRGARPLFNIAQCADGRWICIAAWTVPLCIKALEVLGLTHLMGDERFAGLPNFFPDEAARSELLEILWARFREEPAQKWLDEMDAQGIPCEPVSTIEEFRGLPQLWANGQAVSSVDPVVGEIVQPGVVGQLSETPGEVRPAEASPRPASEAASLLTTWQAASEPPAVSAAPAVVSGRGPLAGVRVLDFSVFLSGPTCTRLLADMGADVTKVESFDGDEWRFSARNFFFLLHRQKKAVVLDLKAPGSDEVLERLVRETDVVVSNYRLGVEARLGLTEERLRAINPKVIVCRMTAFGPAGARAFRGGYDASITSLSGFCYEQCGQGNSPVSTGMADISTGIFTATAILAALRARDRSGRGQALDVSMIGAMAYVGGERFVSYAGKPKEPVLDKGQHGIGPGQRLYETRDGWILVAAAGDAEWRSLCSAVGNAELGKAAPGSGAELPEFEARATDLLASAFATRTTSEWLAALGDARVPCANPIRDFKTTLTEDPNLTANGSFIRVAHPRYGRLGQTGPQVRFSRTPITITRQEPQLGEHTSEVLRELGFSDAVIARLNEERVILSADPVPTG